MRNKKKEKNTRKREMYIYKLCQREEAEALVNVYLKSGCVVRTWAFAINERWLGQDHARVQAILLFSSSQGTESLGIASTRLKCYHWSRTIVDRAHDASTIQTHTQMYFYLILLSWHTNGGEGVHLHWTFALASCDLGKKNRKTKKKKDNFGAKLYIIL